MENLDKEIESKKEELIKQKVELKALKKFNKQLKTFEQLAVQGLSNNILNDVKYFEVDGTNLGSTNKKIICICFKLNRREFTLKIEQDMEIYTTMLLGDNVQKIIAERLVSEMYKILRNE